MFKDRFKGRGAGRGGPGRMVPPSRAVVPIGPRNPRAGFPSSRPLNGNGGGGSGNGKATPPPPLPTGGGTEENFILKPGRGLPFAMIIKLIPGLVEDVKRAQAQGSKVQIKFGPQANNSSGNIIDVGGKEFRFTWAQEPGNLLCDIYEEQQSGEDGNGVLVESGSSWRKLTVQRILNESARDRVKMSSAEAERQQKSRKAIILDHGNPVVKNQTKPVVNTSNDSNARKLLLKTKKEPPPKKRKIEGSSAAASMASDAVAKPAASQSILTAAENIKSANSPVPSQSEQLVTLPQPTLMQKPAGGHSSKGLSVTDEAVTHHHSSKPDVGKRKDKAPDMASTPISEAGNQKSVAGLTTAELRNLLITQLTENPKGLTIKAIEKAIGVPGKRIEPLIKTIATYQAPGRYILKPGAEKESSMRLSPGNRSSPECHPNESPIVDSSPMSEKAGQPSDEQRMHSTPTQDSYLNIVDEIHEHLHESPGPAANQKNTINSDGSGSSSSSDSGSDSESDTGSSDSGSDSGSSSDTESEASSSNNEGSDEHVDIMSDDDKSINEEEIEQKLKDSKRTPSQVDGDGSGESYEQKGIEKEKDDDKLPISSRNSEDVDICDDIGEGEAISNIAKHYVGNLTSDAEDDTEMAVDVDVINCEGEIRTPEEKTTIFTKNGKEENNHSPNATGGFLHTPDDRKIESKKNQIEESLHKTERLHKRIPKQGHGRKQGQSGSDKDRYKQENRAQIEKKEELDPDIKKIRDLASQSCFESPARPEISPSIKDFEARQVSKEINKSRFTDTISERSIENATHLGRSGGQSSAASQIAPTKDLDDERLDQYSDGQQSYQRYSDPDSRSKAPDVMQRPGTYMDHKIKPHNRASRIANESDVSAAKSSVFEEKKSKHEAALRTASEDFELTKDKSNHSSKISKEIENAEKYSRISESQCKRAGDQSGWQSRDVGPSGQLLMVNAPKDTKKTEFDKYQLPSGRESVLKREYSDLELGEFREPLSEEEPQELKARLDKLQAGRGPIDTKVKNGGKRRSVSPNITKGRVIGKEAPESKKSSTSEPIDDFSKHDGRTGIPNLIRPSKKSRKSPPSEHTDLDPLTRVEKMAEMPVKATHAEITKTSPHQSVEVQCSTAYRKSPTNILQKPEYKERVQEAATLENNEDRGITKIDEKRKENTKDNNLVPVRKKSVSSDEEQPFYAKYEKAKADLRGPIKNISQFNEYTQEFKEKYSCYRSLNTSLESDKEDFQKLGRDLQSAKDRGDTKSYATISEKVKKIFSQCSSRHKRMKKVFTVLHEELENLKKILNEFVERY
ncbi:hypothetical protein SUGI_0263780 [Cryptomeria japonica]|uniref:uncharacterized protein LOC131070464 n=1 Tax=Cryptomeria japonica TaxID=3369 RepID=UPI002408DF3D|nr:uncharacterized protein LOC131070464 [Cryptomeria japonica]GLJ15954.1 hypothetical protein SUGI_0263780 [Cryptomeria japonica]